MSRTEKEKMLAGELYHALDPELVADRTRCRDILWRYNATLENESDARRDLLQQLFGVATDAWIQPPFYCDYGTNIALGSKVYFNFNCVVLDVMRVTIGANTLIGPAVQIYTAMHPIDAVERRSGLEYARPVAIGADVWIGGGVIICPGVTIGDRCVIGAGSVVTKDMPSDVFVAGNPARIVRHLAGAPTSS